MLIPALTRPDGDRRHRVKRAQPGVEFTGLSLRIDVAGGNVTVSDLALILTDEDGPVARIASKRGDFDPDDLPRAQKTQIRNALRGILAWANSDLLPGLTG